MLWTIAALSALSAAPRAPASAAADDCVSYASSLCNADAHCQAFGLDGDKIQLHGCNATLALTLILTVTLTLILILMLILTLTLTLTVKP